MIGSSHIVIEVCYNRYCLHIAATELGRNAAAPLPLLQQPESRSYLTGRPSASSHSAMHYWQMDEHGQGK
jgi:hypothetical protein